MIVTLLNQSQSLKAKNRAILINELYERNGREPYWITSSLSKS